MKLLKTLFLTGVLLFLLTPLFPQQSGNEHPVQVADEKQNNTSSLHKPELYDHILAEQEPLFSGSEYRRFPYLFEIVNGIIYFGSNDITRGDVIYFGRQYKDIPLLYDQVLDELITVNMDGNAFIRFFRPEVHSFRIYSFNFINSHDSTNTGFWQVLLDSKINLLKKEVKSIKHEIVDHKIAPVLKTKTLFRISVREKNYNISNKDAIINAFNDQKAAIAGFLKKNRKRFRRSSFETMVIETANYYDKLIAGQ